MDKETLPSIDNDNDWLISSSELEKTIKEILEITTNDFTQEEQKFSRVYNQELLSEEIIKNIKS